MSAVRRITAIAVVLGGLLLGGAPIARADGHEECEKRIHKAEKELIKAIDKHGEDSADAQARRHQLHEIREACHDYEHERHKESKHEEHERHEELEHEMHEH